MKTLVIQPSPTDKSAQWIERCLESVEAWAASNRFDYTVANEDSFELCDADYRARVNGDVAAITNLTRLQLVKDAHDRGYDRAVWMDADVLVFHPDLLTIDIAGTYAFARETRVVPAGNGSQPVGDVGNYALVFMRDEPDLDLIIQLTRSIGLRGKVAKPEQTGSFLVSGLYRSLAFDTLDNVGRFSDHVVLALAHDRDEALNAQAIGHDTPVFAASLSGSDGQRPVPSESETKAAIDRLLRSQGGVINRRLLHSPTSLLHTRQKVGMAALFPLETNLKLQFKQAHGYEPDLAHPKTHSERIAAKKLNLTDEIYRITADKYAARSFVKERVGEDVLIPLLQVCARAEDLDFDGLPSAFILKAAHGSHWYEIVRDKAKANADALRSAMRKWLNSDFSTMWLEAHYRGIPPRVVAEQLLLTAEGEVPEDYRIYVFNGRARMISVTRRTPHGTTSTRFDQSWRRLHVQVRAPPEDVIPPPPQRLPDMIRIAETLAQGFDCVRIDLYCVGEKVFFGEVTHTPNSGLQSFRPADFDAALGALWEKDEPIPEKYYRKEMSHPPTLSPFDPRAHRGISRARRR